MSENYIVKPIAKALQLLEYVVEEGRELALTEISYRTGLPKTTAFRYLQTFCQAGFLSYDPHSDRYRTGVRLWSLANRKEASPFCAMPPFLRCAPFVTGS